MSNYREVDVQLRETLTIKYMKEVQRLLTGRLVNEKEEVSFLKVVRLEANLSRAMLDAAEEREEKEVVEMDVAALQTKLPFIDWSVFMEETIGEEVEAVVSSVSYLTTTSRLLLQILEHAEGRKTVEQYLVSKEAHNKISILFLYDVMHFAY